MGYSTNFASNFELDKVPSMEVQKLMRLLSTTRHGNNTQHDSNYPGFYCQWVLKCRDGVYYIAHDDNEKFHDYIEWIEYIIDNIMKPNDIKLNGEIIWQGEDILDRGCIDIRDNVVVTYKLR